MYAAISTPATLGARAGRSVRAAAAKEAAAPMVISAFTGKGVQRKAPSARRQLPVLVRAEGGSDIVDLDAIDMDAGDYGTSGEWPATLSYASYEDCHEHYAEKVFKDGVEDSDWILDCMSPPIYSAMTDDTVADIAKHFEKVSGIPVVDAERKVVGVLSKKDVTDAVMSKKVGDIMSSPAQTITADKAVSQAASQMLKYKIHRLPVVNSAGLLIGIVSRTDIFTALEK